MNNRTKTVILWTILSLAIFYLIYELFTNTRGLVTQLLLIVGTATVLYLLFRHFILGKVGGGSSKYRKAVKQSKQKYQNQTTSNFKVKDRPVAKTRTSKPKRKTATHLTVIEGKKGKKKNRAFF